MIGDSAEAPTEGRGGSGDKAGRLHVSTGRDAAGSSEESGGGRMRWRRDDTAGGGGGGGDLWEAAGEPVSFWTISRKFDLSTL